MLCAEDVLISAIISVLPPATSSFFNCKLLYSPLPPERDRRFFRIRLIFFFFVQGRGPVFAVRFVLLDP